MNGFEREFARLLQTNYKVKALEVDTDISFLDSLAIAETIVLGEENLGITLEFSEVRRMKTYAGLLAVIIEKKGTSL